MAFLERAGQRLRCDPQGSEGQSREEEGGASTAGGGPGWTEAGTAASLV